MVNILIGCTGSVATVKIPILVEKIKHSIRDCSVRVVATEHANHFFDKDSLNVKVYQDAGEWTCWSKLGDPVLHIDLRNWSDIFVIAPLDANTLGKLAHGICDNLLTCIARAWKIGDKHLVFCPAMNTAMWDHPSTATNINILKHWGYTEIPPICKLLACGDEGIGAMADVNDIFNCVSEKLIK